MCQFDYTQSYKKSSNSDKIAIRASRVGRNPDSCTLVTKPGKTLIVLDSLGDVTERGVHAH